MTEAFVAGWPIAHSLSPKLHGFWLERSRIDGRYSPVAVTPEEFPAFLRGLPAGRFAGGNVTIPHKEAAFALCDETDAAARAIGAVNTLEVRGGRVLGSNTDAHGFSANLDALAPRWRNVAAALVIGAGGAARAVVHALQTAGIGRIVIVNRTFERAQRLAGHFGSRTEAHPMEQAGRLLAQCGLVVNTTSVGMGKDGGAPVSLENAAPGTIVNDLVYVPLQTLLLAEASARGLPAVDGLGMLLHQAAPGFEKWFGVRPDVDAETRNHVLAELARRQAAS